jgi:hypothetical protein
MPIAIMPLVLCVCTHFQAFALEAQRPENPSHIPVSAADDVARNIIWAPLNRDLRRAQEKHGKGAILPSTLPRRDADLISAGRGAPIRIPRWLQAMLSGGPSWRKMERGVGDIGGFSKEVGGGERS